MTGFDISTAQHIYYGGTEVQSLYLWTTKIWPSQHDYSRDYLTFEALENTTFTFTTNDLQYSLDDGTTWTTLTAGTASPTVTTGNKILWKQNGLTPTTTGIGTFSATGNFDVSGNIMSLYYGDNFVGQTYLTGKNYAFLMLFNECNKLVSVENLILPATTLAKGCYWYMFRHCSSLTTAPELPATTLANSCYFCMFEGCTSLTTAPELLATTLAQECYGGMFSGCTSLTTAPELPATTLVTGCYNGMFKNCTSLTTAPELPATTLTQYCYRSMFSGCTSLTTAPELQATTLAQGCYNEMFSGCTSLTTTPELQATTLAQGCYNEMFSGCTSLTTAPELPATILAQGCYNEMFSGCTSLTTSPILPATTLANYCYNEMFRGCTNLNYIKCLATDISATDCTLDWVDNVAASGTFVKEDSMTSWTTGANGIPSGWTVIDYDYSQDYLTFEALENTTFTFTNNALQYSLDNGTTWTTLTAGIATPTVTTGNKILWKQNGLTPTTTGIGTFSATGNFNASGNIMSLYYGDNFIGQTDLTGKNYAFLMLFNECNKLVSVENLILPATTLSPYCYQEMFYNCSSLTTAPELPATSSPSYCYDCMFYGCTALTTAPELPATSLASYCYTNMFNGCTSLTTAPELPATSLADYCYQYMFSGCTSLTTAPAILPATTLAYADHCYNGMFNGCTSLTTAPELPATTLVEWCYYNMFYGCTSLNYIKCLATDKSALNCTGNWVNGVAAIGTFVKNQAMQNWSTGVNGIPSGWTVKDDYSQDYLTFEALESGNITWKAIGTNSPAKTISYSKNNGTWTSIASSSAGTNISVSAGDKIRFKGSENSYATSNSVYSGFENQSGAKFNIYGNIMSLIYGDNFIGQTSFNGGTYNLCSIFKKSNVVSAENLILPATTLADHCYRAMFSNATLLEKAPELPATVLATYCYYYMFESTKITTAPELPVTTLASYCYGDMFKGCTLLTSAPELPATALADYCYFQMFQGCTALTTAPELPATTLANYCYDSMFRGCTNLNYIKCLATNRSASNCTRNWVQNVSATGTFVKNASMSSWTTGNNGIPNGWTVRNA